MDLRANITSEQRKWEEFSSEANPPYPQDGDEHIFSAKAKIKEGEEEGQFIVEHQHGFLKVWESQMAPIADEFAKGANKVQVKWVREGRYTHAEIMASE